MGLILISIWGGTPSTHSGTTTVPIIPSKPLSIEITPPDGLDISTSLGQGSATTSTKNVQCAIIDVDSFEEEYFPDQLCNRQSIAACKGFKLDFPPGLSPHTAYPFALHAKLVLPWDYTVRNSVMTLSARSCTGFSEGDRQLCRPCQQLIRNGTLEGILRRMDEGVHENSPFAYYGFSGLQELLRKKNQLVEFHRLRGLNQARKLLSKATALSDQKRLLMAIASGRVNRVDHVISLGLRQKKGARGLLASCLEEEDMKALLLWKLAGNRVAEINHRSNGAQSVSYLRTRSTVPPIVPSHAWPTVDEVQSNVNAILQGILEVMHHRINSRIIHVALMIDEIATEKRARWDPQTNYILGLCREHAHRVSLEFINEGDLDELFRALDDGDVHYAGEVRNLLPHCFRFEGLSNRSILGDNRRFGHLVQRSSYISWSTCPCIW